MPDTLLPVLVEELASGDQPWEAAAAFAEFGSQAAPVVPRFVVLLKAENPEVRLGALERSATSGRPLERRRMKSRSCCKTRIRTW